MARKTKTTRRSKKQKSNVVSLFEYEVTQNLKAQQEGPRKKSWNVLDIKNIKPLTEAQRAMIESYWEGNEIVATGSAGTGKTYMAVWLALQTVLSKDYPQDNIKIVRSIVPTRDIGFLKGTEEEKIAPYEAPYIDIFADLLKKSHSYEDMKEASVVSFQDTMAIRGVTFNNSVIIIDEFQSMNFHELSSVITRVGKNSRIIVVGDFHQNDLNMKSNDQSGYEDFMKVVALMKEFDVVHFTRKDIVRSSFVKSFICACEDAHVY